MYSDEGALLRVEPPSTGTPSGEGPGCYDPETNLIWHTLFADPWAQEGSTWVASYDADSLAHGPRWAPPRNECESVLLGPDGLLYVGYQQRTFNTVGVEDELWRPLDVFQQDGTHVASLRPWQWGYQMTDWLDWGKTIIFTDEKRLIRILDVESEKLTAFGDMWGTAPEGYALRSEVADASYEDNPGSQVTWGVQASHKRSKIYVLATVFKQGVTQSNANAETIISVWDFMGNHCANWLINATGMIAYNLRMTKDEGYLWVNDYLNSPSAFYRVDAGSGGGVDAPLFYNEPSNERRVGAFATDRIPYGNIPLKMQGSLVGQDNRFEKAEL